MDFKILRVYKWKLYKAYIGGNQMDDMQIVSLYRSRSEAVNDYIGEFVLPDKDIVAVEIN